MYNNGLKKLKYKILIYDDNEYLSKFVNKYDYNYIL